MSESRVSRSDANFRGDILAALSYYTLSLALVLGGVGVCQQVYVQRSHHFIPVNPLSDAQQGALAPFLAWDGAWYSRVATEGYGNQPYENLEFAFFPLYPLLGGLIGRASSVGEAVGLILVSHCSFVCLLATLAAYTRSRFESGGPLLRDSVLLAICLWPSGLFFRMAYSESCFGALVMLALYGIQLRWHPLWVAALIGLSSATRSTGVCLVPVLMLYGVSWCRSNGKSLLLLAPMLVVAVSGLLGYMAFQYVGWGNPFLFSEALTNFDIRPRQDLGESLYGLLMLQPLRDVYDPYSIACWYRRDATASALTSLLPANPVLFVVSCALIAVGGWKRWLNAYEVTTAVMLLLVPYVLKGHASGMAGMGRYSAVVLPMYLVVGKLLLISRPWVRFGLICLCGTLLALYSGLFGNWYHFA